MGRKSHNYEKKKVALMKEGFDNSFSKIDSHLRNRFKVLPLKII